MAFRNAAVCAGVHTATTGRMPERCHCLTRRLVHTTACGRRPRGSFRYRAGLSASSRSRTAAFSADRSVEWTRRAVAAVIPCFVSNAVNTFSRWPTCNSASSTVPRCGMR
jgi:hypothetical protein